MNKETQLSPKDQAQNPWDALTQYDKEHQTQSANALSRRRKNINMALIAEALRSDNPSVALQEAFPDTFAPKTKTVEQTISPYSERVLANIDKIYDILKDFDKTKDLSQLPRLVSFFSEKFDIKHSPTLEVIEEKKDPSSGCFSRSQNTITINFDKCKSSTDIVDVLGHESWHARQYEIRGNHHEYLVNYLYYVESKVDFDAYKKQILEAEAFAISRKIRTAYSQYLLEHDQENSSSSIHPKKSTVFANLVNRLKLFKP